MSPNSPGSLTTAAFIAVLAEFDGPTSMCPPRGDTAVLAGVAGRLVGTAASLDTLRGDSDTVSSEPVRAMAAVEDKVVEPSLDLEEAA